MITFETGDSSVTVERAGRAYLSQKTLLRARFILSPRARKARAGVAEIRGHAIVKASRKVDIKGNVYFHA